jgi:hypothetical protein
MIFSFSAKQILLSVKKPETGMAKQAPVRPLSGPESPFPGKTPAVYCVF